MYSKSVLENGCQVITIPVPGGITEAVCVLVRCGSSNETPKKAGISHLLEHLCFAGTKKWPRREKLMTTIEGMGGATNGETRKESTIFWIKTRKGQLKETIKIISDMITNPLINHRSVMNEKQAIIAQIKRRYDFPKRYLWDMLFKTMWPDHPLAQEGLGNKNSLASIDVKSLLEYKRLYYTPDNIVYAIASNQEHDSIVRLVRQYTTREKGTVPYKPTGRNIIENQVGPRLRVVYQPKKQVYSLLGIRAYSRSHPQKFTLMVLSALLGMGFSSRLCLNLRNKRNLIFSPHSTVIFFKDTGLLAIEAQLKESKEELAVRGLLEELGKLRKDDISENELKYAKERLKAKIIFEQEAAEKLAEWYGTQALLQSKVLDIEEVMGKIDLVTSREIVEVARDLFTDNRLNLVLVGPLHHGRVKDIEANLAFRDF